MYFVYILTNQSHSVLYIWVTNNLWRRLGEHSLQYEKSFVGKYKLKKLIYYEEYKSVQEAIQREKQLKNRHRERKNNLISAVNPEWKEIIVG